MAAKHVFTILTAAGLAACSTTPPGPTPEQLVQMSLAQRDTAMTEHLTALAQLAGTQLAAVNNLAQFIAAEPSGVLRDENLKDLRMILARNLLDSPPTLRANWQAVMMERVKEKSPLSPSYAMSLVQYELPRDFACVIRLPNGTPYTLNLRQPGLTAQPGDDTASKNWDALAPALLKALEEQNNAPQGIDVAGILPNPRVYVCRIFAGALQSAIPTLTP